MISDFVFYNTVNFCVKYVLPFTSSCININKEFEIMLQQKIKEKMAQGSEQPSKGLPYFNTTLGRPEWDFKTEI